jgi:hypothetical protein
MSRFNLNKEQRMKNRFGSMVLLAVVFALATSVAGFAQCGLSNIYCQPWDGTGNIFASQNDPNNFGPFATTYDQFTLTKGWDVESFHFFGGYFNPGVGPNVSSIELTFWTNNNGVPGTMIGNPLDFANFNETLVSGGVYSYDLINFPIPGGSVDLKAGTYFASVVGTLGFPPQWGWATGVGPGLGYQCFFGTCGPTATSFAFGLDGTPLGGTPEPGTLIMLGTGILGLAGTLRRKLL